ncbi:hypothetical protein J0H58_21985 [bacterium]|nr:hypothetical protein [bacterium]
MPKSCPRCRTANVDDAIRCECGADLSNVPVVPAVFDPNASPYTPLPFFVSHPRRTANVVGYVALLFLLVCPPWAVSQVVGVGFASDDTAAVSGLQHGESSRVVANLGHRWSWVALGSRPTSVDASFAGNNVTGLRYTNLPLGLDFRLLLAELGLGALTGVWALLLASLPRTSK